MSSALCLTKMSIWPKFNEIISGVKETWSEHEMQGSNTWPSIVTLTFGPRGWDISSAHYLCEENIWLKFNENPFRDKGDIERTQNTRLKMWTSTVTLSPHGWAMSSAHGLNKVNILPSFTENRVRGPGDMKRTQNARLEYMTFSCDRDLMLAWLIYGSCTSSHWDEHFIKV